MLIPAALKFTLNKLCRPCRSGMIDLLLVWVDQQAEWSDVYAAGHLPRPASNLHRRNNLLSPAWEIRRQDAQDAERVCWPKHLRLLNYCWRAFWGYQHRWPWTTLSPQNRGFCWIFSDFRLQYTFYEWIAPKPFKIDQDNLHMECLALNIDFNSVRFDALGSRRPPYEHQISVPCSKRALSAAVD